MNISAVCSDIDGTLLDDKRELSKRTIEVISLIRHTTPVILASSRMPSAMRHLQRELGIEDHPLISYNGGYILRYRNRSEVYDVLDSVQIPLSVCSTIVSLSATIPVHVSLYSDNDWFAARSDQWTEREARITKVSPTILSFDRVIDNWQAAGRGAHKVMCMGDASHIDELTHSLEHLFPGELNIYRSKSTYLEIAPGSVSKASGLRKLMDHYYMKDLSMVMAFGDNYNDVEMIRSCGYGIAVANARPEVKSVAWRETAISKEDGVAVAIEKYFGLK